MTRDQRRAKREHMHNFYMEQLRKAENPYAHFTGMAISIGECKEYTKTEKGQALETLAMAWMDFTKNK